MSHPISVVAVDDHPVNRRLMAAVLKRFKYEVRTADGGTEMWQLLEHELPDVILMDLRMPDVDGLTLTRMLKERDDTAHIPVIAVTADVVRASRVDAEAAGCVAFIGKPIDAKALRHTIELVLAT